MHSTAGNARVAIAFGADDDNAAKVANVTLAVLGLMIQFLALTCFVFVLLHAFQRSVGTGFMVLLIPIVGIVYGFGQFEHRRKGLILAGWLGGFVVALVLRTMALHSPAA